MIYKACRKLNDGSVQIIHYNGLTLSQIIEKESCDADTKCLEIYEISKIITIDKKNKNVIKSLYERLKEIMRGEK